MDKKKIIKNTVVYWTGQVSNKILIFFLTVLIARFLGPGEFGKYSLVVTIVGFCWLFSDAGLSLLAFREVSKYRDLTGKYYSHSIYLKNIFSIICVLMLVLLTGILRYDKSLILLLLIYSITLFAKSISSSCESIFNAYEEMHLSAMFSVIMNFPPLLLGYIVLKSGYGLDRVFFIISGCYLLVAVANFVFTSNKYGGFNFKFDLDFDMASLKQSVPLMLAGFLGYVAFQLPVPMLAKMRGNAELGYFSAPFRLIEGLMLFSTGFMVAIFPTMSRYGESSLESLKSISNKGLKILFAFGLTLAVVTTLFSGKIIYIFYGNNYSNSIMPLIIFIWALMMIYLTAVFYNVLLATNKQNTVIVLQILCIFVCFLLNLLLIPPYGFMGAAFSVFGTQIFSLLIFAIAADRLVFRRG